MKGASVRGKYHSMDELDDLLNEPWEIDNSKLIQEVLIVLLRTKRLNEIILANQVQLEAQLSELREQVIGDKEMSESVEDLAEKTKSLYELVSTSANDEYRSLLSRILI